MLSKNKGITLVALVITVVVLLILAGVSINFVLGENGLIIQAQESKRKTKESTANELADLDRINTELAKYGNIQNVFEGGNWNETLGLCTPKLGTNMVGVYWSDGTKNEMGLYVASATSTNVEVTSEQPEFSWSEWYNYRAESEEKLDSKKSRWANAKSIIDGSYFVWIPRYEYKILSGEHTSTAGEIDVEFINLTTTTANKDGYKVHPAFTTNLQLGGWDKNISGVWIAKYEMSMEEKSNTEETWINRFPKLTLNITNISENVRMVSKPNRYPWTYINISNSFSNSKKYSELQKTGANSHLIKNSEWGAVVYLAHSKYGRNGNEVALNNYNDEKNNTKLTGFSIGVTNSRKTNENKPENQYNGINGMKASTTGNLYGIYDFNGGDYEQIAMIYSNTGNNNQESLYNEIGYSFEKDNRLNKTPDSKDSTKYVTIYPINTETAEEDASIHVQYNEWSSMYGDAMYETSNNVPCSDGSWFLDHADHDGDTNTNEPVIIRGGYSDWSGNAGIFAFADYIGVGSADCRLSYNINL